jgi:hypothetical protein
MRRLAEAVTAVERRPEATRTIPSVRAFLLPHIVNLFTATPGRVKREFVRERQLLAQGQDLFEIERDDGSSAPQSFVLKSSKPGLVLRRWARTGDEVERARPIVSVIRCDDVLVLGLFERTAVERALLTMRALVSIGELPGTPFEAAVLRVGMNLSSKHAAACESRHEFIRALVQIPSVPSEALRPGLAARVDLVCE